MTKIHSRNSFVEDSTITTKGRAQHRAHSVAFACNIERNLSTKGVLLQPSTSTVEERRKSTKNDGAILPVSKG